MQVDFLKLMSEIMIDYNFNRPDKAISGIRKLLTNHQNEIGGSNVLGMTILACQIDGFGHETGSGTGIKNEAVCFSVDYNRY